MPGMLSEKGLRVTRRDSDGYVVGYYEDLSYIAECVAGTLPDLTDPATLGCLLALVREAHGQFVFVEIPVGLPKRPFAQLVSLTEYAGLALHLQLQDCKGLTEVEALVAALEVAP
jgi:hypothetical protein